MSKKSKSVVFKSVKEYREYYASNTLKRPAKGSRYYQIGRSVARTACEKVVSKLSADHPVKKR